jgi:hypothetical protein
MNSTSIASRDYDSDGIAGSGPSLVVVEAPAVVVVMVVKEALQQQRELQVGAGGWRDGQQWRLQMAVVAHVKEEGHQQRILGCAIEGLIHQQ